MQFRHEVKHEISRLDMLLLRQRLNAVMKPDSHALQGKYEIRSLYFDDLEDTALREKLDGISVREKYRIRLYNRDPSAVFLERKYKCGGLGCKTAVSLTAEQARMIADGRIEWMRDSSDALVRAFYTRFRNERLRAKTLVDYTREPFVFAAGNVRVTLDYDIRTGLGCTDLFAPAYAAIPVQSSPCILEVKWDGYLPDVVRNAVQLDSRQNTAFSKYAACRMYD